MSAAGDDAMRVLAVGDSYLSSDVMRAGLEGLEGIELELLQLDETRALEPETDSERRIREHAGTPDQLVGRLDGVEVLVVHGAPVTDDVLAAGTSLRLVACARGGPVNVDLAAAAARGVPVVSTPGKNAEAVADQTLAFLVMLARGFPRAMRFMAEGGQVGASAFEGAEFFGHDLGGHTLGLVGYGQVAQRVARRAHAFGMELVTFDPFREPQSTDLAASVATLEELLERSDFVSLHCRATPQTENLMSTERFALMRRGACFVNTARETLVDEAALDAALSSGRLAGAALDVVRPLRAAGAAAPHPLLRHSNVVLLPHIGGATHETLLRGVTMLRQAIERLRDGGQLANVANAAALGTA